MEMQVMKRSISPAKISAGRGKCADFTLQKEIVVHKDVNGIAITEDNTVLLAIGTGSLGGIGELDIETEQLTVHQQGTPHRQIHVGRDDCILTAVRDKIHTYGPENLDKARFVDQPGPKVWGLCQTPQNQIFFGDTKKKKVYKRDDHGCSMIIKKTEENKLASVWSLACSADRLYISDRKKRQVVCTRHDGSFLWRHKLGRPYSKVRKALKMDDAQESYFGGMCVEPSGNLLVCDTINNQLTELSPDGGVTNYTDLDLDQPADVAINGGCMVIVNHPTLLDCTIKVYRQSTTL